MSHWNTFPTTSSLSSRRNPLIASALLAAILFALAPAARAAAAPPAHATADYHALAVQLRARQAHFAALAADEKKELDRRQSAVTSVSLKFPSAVDSARARYDSLVYQEHEAASQAAHYEQLAASAQ